MVQYERNREYYEGLDPRKDRFQKQESGKITFAKWVQTTMSKIVRKVFDLPDYSKRKRKGWRYN